MGDIRKLSLCLATALLFSSAASAHSVGLVLNRVNLTNVDDAAGTTQHEDGTLQKGTKIVGNYFMVRRYDPMSGGLFNAASTEITLEFASKKDNPAPEVVIIHGVHDFNTGDFKGSVSAASSYYSWIRDASASYVPATASSGEALTIQGSFTGVHLP